MSLKGNGAAMDALHGRIHRADKVVLNAYDIAVKHGFKGTEEEWLESLNGGIISIDSLLYRRGMAADAKAVGDRLKPLDDHASNTANPHGVTAEQIGARPNTWMPTASEVGAAPAGYGLGTVGADVSDANHVFDVFRNGWFRTFSSTANTAVAHGAGIALVYDANRALHLLAKTTAGTMRTRYTPNSDGVFVEDLINPPMTAGYEYRTIERWNGKTVYTKLVSVGALGASGTTTKSLGANGVKIIDFDVIGYTTGGPLIKFPRVDTEGNIMAKCWVQDGTIWFSCIVDNTDVTECYATIKYVKD